MKTNNTFISSTANAEQKLFESIWQNPLTSCFSNQPTTLPLTNPRAYYRSQIISAETGINSLTTAATGLLTLLTNIKLKPINQDARALYQDLLHEIKAFESLAQNKHYRAETILLARYALCSALDEAILDTSWSEEQQWHKYKLLSTFHQEDWGGERFFHILERLSQDPKQHSDILELMYICLSLGYQGKYKTDPDNKNQLEKVIENLYHCIRWQRGDIKKELFLESHNLLKTTEAHPPVPLWLTGIFTSLVLVTVYMLFNFFLGNSVAPVYHELNSILQIYA